MKNGAEILMSGMYNAYTDYDIIPFDRQNFYHLCLSLFAWNVLSENSHKQNNALKKQLPASFSFNEIMTGLGKKTYQEKIEKALWECEKCNPAWHGLWILNPSLFDNLSYEKWMDIATLWQNFGSGAKQNEKRTLFIILAEELESWMISDLRELSDVPPTELTMVMASYLNKYVGESLYDPYSRSGNLLFTVAQDDKQLQYVCSYAPGILFRKFTELRMLLLDNKTQISVKKNPEENTYLSVRYDKIISNPPFGNQNTDYRLETPGEWAEFTRKSNRTDVAFLCHALSVLSDKGHAAILLPAIFLSGNGITGELIKHILEKNILDAVIEMPQGLFSHTAIQVVLFLFSKTRADDKKILLLDASTETNKQGRSISLNEKKLKDIINNIHTGEYPKGEYFCLVSKQEIERKKYDLRQLSYRKKTIMPDIIVPSTKLLQEIKQLEAELIELQKNIMMLVSSKK